MASTRFSDSPIEGLILPRTLRGCVSSRVTVPVRSPTAKIAPSPRSAILITPSPTGGSQFKSTACAGDEARGFAIAQARKRLPRPCFVRSGRCGRPWLQPERRGTEAGVSAPDVPVRAPLFTAEQSSAPTPRAARSV